MFNSWTLPLNSEMATLALCGGKGAHLAQLVRAGLPVPGGFLITTEAYRKFVAKNNLQPAILAALAQADVTQPAVLDAASCTIRDLFSQASILPEIANAITQAYLALNPQSEIHNPQSVAVRSSATAEDLPDMSFAGQQDTYLNVQGEAAVLEAVVKCWSSLWTARAIGYRARYHIAPEEVQLAVVVQTMVPSEAAGVLFTANPLTGKRLETVIDATLGLGEALVAGLVEPDHYVVEGGRITAKKMGAKALSIRGAVGGGTLKQTEQAGTQQALPDEAILELAQLGQRVEVLYGAPQDIEWGWAEGRLHLLQARPITTLYPALSGLPDDGQLRVFISFGAVQGILEPITPLGRDIFCYLAASIGTLLSKPLEGETQQALFEAGERLFINITTILRHPFGRRAMRALFPLIEPGSVETLERLLADPRLALREGKGRLSGRTVRAVASMLRNVLYNLLWPTAGRARIQRRIEQYLVLTRSRFEPAQNLAACLQALDDTFEDVAPFFMHDLVTTIASGQIPLHILRKVLKEPDKVWALTRGLPYNVTTEMDLALWAAACTIKADPTSAATFATQPAPALAADYLAGRLPPAAQSAVADFLQRYGVRGVAEIDLGRPCWNEDPTLLMQMLGSYLQIEDPTSPSAPSRAPAVVFARSAAAADALLQQFIETARKMPVGWLRVQVVRWAGQRVRGLTGLRETPKFAVVRTFAPIRAALLRVGQKLVTEGTFTQADDIFFLHLRELKQLAAGAQGDWQTLVAERRAAYAREMQRKLIPRVLLSDGMAFYEGVSAPPDVAEGESANILVGSPVSPGVVEGVAHVVFDPHAEQLAPGEILVCPGTDPAWTPLFLAAGGLIMEVGGLMTHGAVVAREYGIPAVVGVSHATTRIQTGERLQVDGASGKIMKLG
jgi:rifampicin phosphotransferase